MNSRIIPVLDAMGGRVVRAVGGRRELYEPIESMLTASTEPVEVAEALLRTTRANELYIADLDAIQGHRPYLRWIRPLVDRGCSVMVDAGVKMAADAIPIAAAGASVVVGTETLRGYDELAKLVQAWDPDRVWLSIDMRNEVVLGSDGGVVGVLEQGLAAGAKRFILLELARVGTGLGPGTVNQCRTIRQSFPSIELLAGGGVRNQQDVDDLIAAGANGVLVASALHDGTIRSAPPA